MPASTPALTSISNPHEGMRKFRQFMEEAADLVVRYGGSLSGEHGDGQARAELLPKMFGPELMQAFREFKSLWDPDWKMNPGKLIEPYRLDENLRLGADYDPWQPETHFKFPDDHGSLAAATLRCVGVGKCRRDDGGVMCPSYRVTREEEHSTRGRAHLLWEMTKGDVIKDGWQSEAVKESLDLCLACKGCKSDCPVGVDVATYKAEFLSHYYETNRASAECAGPFEYRSVGASRVARSRAGESHDPTSRLCAILPSWPPESRPAPHSGVCPSKHSSSGGTKKSYGSGGSECRVRRRQLGSVPSCSGPTLSIITSSPRQPKLPSKSSRLPGFDVTVPQRSSLLRTPALRRWHARPRQKLLLQIMDELLPEIEAATPIVVLEPSCAAVFRDELTNLFPKDERAQALSKQVFLLSEFLEQRAKNFPLPQLPRRALIHGHCHHKAIMKMTAEEAVLDRMGVDFTAPAPGCCGMAGAFGFEKEKYDVSKAIGELELLPAVRQAPTDWLIVADGFSCREQIAQETDRHALHLAEVLQMALQRGN